MPNDTFASFGRRLDVLVNGLRDPELKGVMKRVGEAAQKDAEKAARADLGGDLLFSGWKKNPFVTELKHPAEGQVQVRPRGRARGMVRVAEEGRNRGNTGLFAGPGLNVRTGRNSRGGVRQTGVRRSKRWNGMTAPKHTWSDAEALIEKASPKRIDDEVRKAIRKAMG